MESLVNKIKGLVGNAYLYFGESVNIAPEGTLPKWIWAICAAPDNSIFIMDADEVWYPLGSDVPERVIQILEEKVNQIVEKNKDEYYAR